ncbi:hypothetical protein MC885_004467 [Smutsia gigantea]|nr:hypothetical protein MC885_004467 [Smutsia gigantea]
MVFFLIAVIYKKFHVPCPLPSSLANSTGNLSLVEVSKEEARLQGEAEGAASCRPSYFTLNTQTAYTVPIMAFAFVCHPEVLPIYTELKDASKRKMQHIANLSIAVMYVMYFLAALFGYLTFYGMVGPWAQRRRPGWGARGWPVAMAPCAPQALTGCVTPDCARSCGASVESELLHTYSKVDPFDVLVLCVRVAVLTAVTLTVPIVLFPVRRLEVAGMGMGMGAGARGASGEGCCRADDLLPYLQVRRALQQMLFQEQAFSWLRHTLIAAGLLTCINLLVIFAPNILGIFGVIGEELALLWVEAGTAPEKALLQILVGP